VGTWKNVRVDSGKLVGDLTLATTNLARMAKQLLDDGVLKAVSVGFRIIDWESRDPENDPDGWKGWVIKKAELLETSLVSVPAQPQALLVSKKFGLSAADRRLIFSSSKQEKTTPTTSGDDHPAVIRALKSVEEIRRFRER
jgi:phage head maturation protease